MSVPLTTAAPAGGVRTLRVGTRGSVLARLQTQVVIDALAALHPDIRCEPVVISVQGDRDKQTPLSVLGGQGIFAGEIERSIQSGEIDCAVHSVKDLTSTLPDGLVLASVLDRVDPRDVLLSRYAGGLAGLPRGARVGTSSPRRKAQLRVARPDLEIIELRGNVDTRVSRALDDPERAYDAAILAAAGVDRMGWSERVSERLDVATFTPAPGQGALGVECRANDTALRTMLASIADPVASIEVEAERAFLRAIDGGCRAPLAATARVEGDRMRIWAMFADESMTRIAFTEDEADLEDGPSLAEALARQLKDQVCG